MDEAMSISHIGILCGGEPSGGPLGWKWQPGQGSSLEAEDQSKGEEGTRMGWLVVSESRAWGGLRNIGGLGWGNRVGLGLWPPSRDDSCLAEGRSGTRMNDRMNMEGRTEYKLLFIPPSVAPGELC